MTKAGAMKAIRLFGLLAAVFSVFTAGSAASTDAPAKPSLYYHIFVRSFADSNGDHIGDLPGLTAHLDYLEGLHVTHIMVTPVQASPFYHNYFATDFDAVDPAYGGDPAWLAFVRAAHAHRMKVILDEEFQYVAQGHSWWRDNEARPGGPFGRFVLWNRPDDQTSPEPFLSAPSYRSYDGSMIGIAMVNLNQPSVKKWFQDMLLRRVDPRGDGDLSEGVDGFRIDHMMDDLDSKHRITNLFSAFWRPTIEGLRQTHPKLEFIAEQSDWGYGADYLKRSGADAVFAFPVRKAITQLDKHALIAAMAKTAAATPNGTRQLIFIENHDVDRFASLVRSDPRKLRIGAVLDLTLGRDAIIYYGQELGMRGRERAHVPSDAAQIPMREAFRWAADLDASGSAIWYRGDDIWWTERANRSNDGVSVEEEDRDPGSLLNTYRKLTALRARRHELGRGDYVQGCQDKGPVFCFTRRLHGQMTFVAINLSPRTSSVKRPSGRGLINLVEGARVSSSTLSLAPWGLAVIGTPATVSP